ncbi:early protein E1 [Human papillomavirus 157]|uniref:Replication protein E1 n=1 Tax=Human papillomavirus 157 TaxID=2259331 RepID=A0A166FK25_9PAPI|nr:early protein E1 [Human papillomavirus 157]
MGDPHKGTSNFDCLENINDWCVITEAECMDSVDTLSELFDADTDASNISNLIDDDLDSNSQGNSLALFNCQEAEECNKAISDLKRKFIESPVHAVETLSPRLLAVHISPQRHSNSKRKLFEDSGIADDETADSFVQVEPLDNSKNGASQDESAILKSSNVRATLHFKFKEKYNVSFNELTRNFKSDKTCNHNWIIAVFAVREELIEASKTLMKPYCDYIQMIFSDFSVLYLVEFKNTKNRETIIKLITQMLSVNEKQILCEPPRTRSTATAMFFYRKALANTGFKSGEYPQWLASLTLVDHQLATAETFKLSEMVQWAYDNDYVEEAQIAYYYAQYAEVNSNAAASLESNQQVKYVKDCCSMVNLYKRQELRNMSMGAWIKKCCGDNTSGDGWKEIARFLKYQHVNMLSFLITLKQFLKNIPKKSCMVLYGPPDSGKSYFAFSLVKLLKGKVVSFMNKGSHFWTQPLVDAKIGLLDDATFTCWTFLDMYMRNAFDGNTVSIDVKHKNLQQIRLPPIIITTNVSVPQEVTLKYLQSRLTCFEFPNAMPFDDRGNPVFKITTEHWAMFFSKFFRQLDLEEEDGDSADAGRTFCCTARNTNDSD